ncbi:MAG TPA: N-acetylmuramoyl-L-alanine amidase [Steroidobacteraceae bacterium]
MQFLLRTDKQALVMAQDGQPRTGTPPHWPGAGRANFGTRLAAVHSIVIHGTSGWPSHQSATNMTQQYLCQVATKQGEGPTYVIDCNGTVQQLIDTDPPRVTLHAGYMNGISLGIENTDIGDASIRPSASSLYWRRPSGLANDRDDLAGLQLYVLLHPREGEGSDVIPLWFPTSRYTGPGDSNQFSEFHTLFTDADYRSLALLSRLMTAELGVPRNFPLLPYQDRGSNANDVGTLRRLVLADERGDAMISMFGRTREEFTSNAATLDQWYKTCRYQVTRVRGDGTTYRETANTAWTDFFADTHTAAADSKRCYRGFLTHVMPGSTSSDGDHNCPGPYFDWHRFAREVWDWWWYPFDFDHVFNSPIPVPALATRAYREARKDTPLLDYYYDALVHDAEYQAVRTPAAAASSAESDEFDIGQSTPIYALANGVAVAARIPNETTAPGQMGFLLTRHEVFHRTQSVEHGGIEIALSAIDYDRPPSYVFSLISHVRNPSVNFDDLTGANPDWLNRLIKRLYECKKASEFRRDHATDNDLKKAWRYNPLPEKILQRWSVGGQIERDAEVYQSLIDELKLAHTVCFPLEHSLNATTVRVILGDYLGVAARPARDGVGITLFSVDELPVPGRVHGTSAWSTQDWWQAAANATLLETEPARAVPRNGIVWRYPMFGFLKWINDITWASEWTRYRVDGNRPEKPRPRRGL